MAKKKTSKKQDEKISSIDDIFDFAGALDVEEKNSKLSSVGISSSVDPKECSSTGMLSMDLGLGGGIKGGSCYEIVGPEQSGKTTTLYSIFGEVLTIAPNRLKGIFIDAEGLIDPRWFGNICGTSDMNSIFGLKDEETGKWRVKPQIRYYKPAFGEQALKHVKNVLKRLPDKVLIGDTYYYMWIPRESKKAKKGVGYTATELRSMLKDKYVKKLYSKYGAFYVPVPNNFAGPELIIGVDSWPSLTPEAIAEDDSDAMGGPARMFGKHMNDIKNLIASKSCTLVGINQVRERPMCLNYDSQILLADGTKEKIGEIIRKKIQVDVLSYNFETKKFESKPIVNWMNNGIAEENEFKVIRVSDGSPSGSSSLKVTPDHTVFCNNNEEKKVKDLTYNDKLLVKSNEIPTSDSLQVILGGVLGDGYLSRYQKGKGRAALRFGMSHGKEQAKYCEKKEEVIRGTGGYYHGEGAYESSTFIRGSLVLDKVYDEAYDYSGESLIRRFSPTLEKKIDLRGIAIWYLDDGQIVQDGFYFLGISVAKYSDEDVEKLRLMLCNKTGLNWESYIKPRKDGRITKLLKLTNTYSIKKFLKMVGPYFISKDELNYKLGKLDVSKSFSYNWKPKFTSKLRKVSILDIYTMPRSTRNNVRWSKYDIEVKDNHNFIADGVLVHNSWGNPEYYPGGNTLKHITDCRIRTQSVNDPVNKKQTEEDGVDKYRHFKFKTVKNKLWIPYREGTGRWWIEHDGDSGFGPCPVYDTLQYLKMTGQFRGKKDGFVIKLKGSKSNKVKKLAKVTFTMETFKEAILNKKVGKEEIDIRKLCYKQLKSGKGLKLYLKGSEEEE